jgi:hypothetical protein
MHFAQPGEVSLQQLIPEERFTAVSTLQTTNFSATALLLSASGNVWQTYHSPRILPGRPSEVDITVSHIEGLSDIIAVSAGTLNFALDSHGKLWQWGLDNTVFDAALNYLGTIIENPEQVLILPPVIHLLGDRTTTYAISADGSLWLRGYDRHGLLETKPTRVLVELLGDHGINFYPFYAWSEVPQYSSVESIELGRGMLQIQMNDRTVIHRINLTTPFNPAFYTQFYAHNNALLLEYSQFASQENIEAGLVFHWKPGFVGGVPMFYP